MIELSSPRGTQQWGVSRLTTQRTVQSPAEHDRIEYAALIPGHPDATVG
jgi:hypothetical protein